MKPYIFAAVLLMLPLAVSADNNERPQLKRQFRAQASIQSAGLNVLIIGPESVSPGTLVKLDASQTTGDTFNWMLAGGNSELYSVSDDGKKVYFASPSPGTYSFLLAVAKANGDKPPLLVMAEHKIVIQGTSPKPVDPNVNPAPPTPVDPLDAGKYGLARYVRDLVRGAIPSEKRGLASAFSANYALVASSVRNKTTTGFSAAIADATSKNRASAGDAIAVWRDPVFVPLGNKLNDLIKAQVINTADTESIATLFSELSLGFAAAVGN